MSTSRAHAAGEAPGLRRILLAVDASLGSRAAEIATAALASQTDAEVLVVHVWDQGYWSTDIEEEANERAAGVVSDLAAFGIAAQAGVRSTTSGDVAGEIAAAAADFHPDLVVMGSRRRSDLGRLLLGSVSHQVLTRVEAPVMLVRSGRRSVARRSRILVAVQGQEDAAALVDTVVRIAEPHAQALVLHVDGDWEPAARRAVVEEVVAGLHAYGIRARGRSTAADWAGVPAGLASAAKSFEADLVVLGSRRLSDLASLLRVSVSGEIAHLVDALVLIGRFSPEQRTSRS
jgi:nucleotide-binding universal stress UspA family protein